MRYLIIFLFLLFSNASFSMSVDTAINNYFIGSKIDNIEGVWKNKSNSKMYAIKIYSINKYYIYDILSETVWGEIIYSENKWNGICTINVSEENDRFKNQKFQNEDLEIYMITKNLLEARCNYSINVMGQYKSGVLLSKFERVWPKNIDRYNKSVLQNFPSIDLKEKQVDAKDPFFKNILGKLIGK